jgi:hypothetical protein
MAICRCLYDEHLIPFILLAVVYQGVLRNTIEGNTRPRRPSLYGESLNKSNDKTFMHSRSSGIQRASNSSHIDHPDLQAPFLDDSDDAPLGKEDDEAEEDEARLREEEEALGIAEAIAAGKKPTSTKIRVTAPQSGPKRGKSLKKWFKKLDI